MPKPITVVSLGPGPSVPGGITQVIELIGTHLPSSTFRAKHVSTFTRYTGDTEVKASQRGNRLGQSLVYFGALAQAFCFRFGSRTIFHVHFAGKGSLLRKGLLCVLLRFIGARYVIHSHVAGTDLFPHWMPNVARRLTIWGFRGSRRIIVLTKFWADFYTSRLGIGANQFIVLPNPADIPNKVTPRSSSNQLSLVFLGRVGARKGAFDLIHAFAALPEDVRSRAQLTLAGDGETDRARALADQLGVADGIRIPGWVDRKEVGKLLASSDVLILPSYAEGMAMALIEGMSWGLSIIATKVGGAGEFLQDRANCLLVTPGDTQGLADAITKLHKDPPLRLELGRAARTTVSRFGIADYISTLGSLYKEIVDSGSARATPLSEPEIELRGTSIARQREI